MSLKNIVVSTKEVTVEFPGLDGFEVTVGAISRDLLRQMNKKATKTVIDPALKMPVEKLDEELFTKLFTEAAVKTWKGLTYEHLAQLMLVDEDAIADMSEEIPHCQEDACLLLKESATFDSWINGIVYDIARFRGGKQS
jgi:hypothetical protein